MNTLEKILDQKRVEVAQQIVARPHHVLETAAAEAPSPRGFRSALRAAMRQGFGLIAEVKKASPSKGVIRSDFDPAALARAYAAGGATCLSVLTDEKFFQGGEQDLIDARGAVELPVLRKDFMVAPYQIIAARAAGADCVLVILAAVDDSMARDLMRTAQEWGMDTLVEVHNRAEMDRAKGLGADLIGVNNRDLTSFTTDLRVTEDLAVGVDDDVVLVSESGINQPADIERLAQHGVRCFLVGESLMRETDVQAATERLLAARVPESDSRPAQRLTHLDNTGAARMVDVGDKPESERTAVARGYIEMRPETLQMIVEHGHPKGDVFTVARLAGIMAAKQTAQLIPLCHPLALSSVAVDLQADAEANRVQIEATVRVRGATGVEMEALTAVSVTALTIYDMCKAVDREMRVSEIRLMHKSGGRSGTFDAQDAPC